MNVTVRRTGKVLLAMDEQNALPFERLHPFESANHVDVRPVSNSGVSDITSSHAVSDSPDSVYFQINWPLTAKRSSEWAMIGVRQVFGQ